MITICSWKDAVQFYSKEDSEKTWGNNQVLKKGMRDGSTEEVEGEFSAFLKR